MPEPEEREAIRRMIRQVEAYLARQVHELLRQQIENEHRGMYPVAKPTSEQMVRLPEAEDGMLANGFLIGCDPEFAVLDGEEALNVNELGRGLLNERIGVDHGGDVVELRPEPAKGSFTLVKRIKALIEDERLGKLKPYKWRAGAHVSIKGVKYPAPNAANAQAAADNVDPGGLPGQRWRPVWDGNAAGVVQWQQEAIVGAVQPPRAARPRARISLGGHIHIDLSPFPQSPAEAVPDQGNEGEYDWLPWNRRPSLLHQKRIKALDHLTKRLEALDILPRVECEARRQNALYGRFGDVREQPNPHGGYRFEYRTMPSWLFDPKIAMLCLTGAKLAAVDPDACLTGLGRFHDFRRLAEWFEAFKDVDINARRVCENILTSGIKGVSVNPDRDFRESWAEFAL